MYCFTLRNCSLPGGSTQRRRSERVRTPDGDSDTMCKTDVVRIAGSLPAARTSGEKNTTAGLDCPELVFTAQELHATRLQPGSVTPAAPGSLPRAASAASWAS